MQFHSNHFLLKDETGEGQSLSHYVEEWVSIATSLPQTCLAHQAISGCGSENKIQRPTISANHVLLKMQEATSKQSHFSEGLKCSQKAKPSKSIQRQLTKECEKIMKLCELCPDS